MTRELFPTSKVEVKRRQGITPDVFGMGNFYAPNDFFGEASARPGNRKRRLVQKALDRMAQQPGMARARKAEKVLAAKLVRRKAPAVIKGMATTALRVEAARKRVSNVPQYAGQAPKLAKPKFFRDPKKEAIVDAEIDAELKRRGLRRHNTQQAYMSFAPAPTIRAMPQRKDVFGRLRDQALKVPRAETKQDYIDPASINKVTDGFERTATEVIPAAAEPETTIPDQDIPAGWFDPMESITDHLNNDFIVPHDEPLGEPKDVTVIKENAPEATLFNRIDRQIRPRQLTRYEELGFPYKAGEAQRYAGMLKGKGAVTPLDPTVIKGKPWQSPGFQHLNFDYNPLEKQHGGMGAWPPVLENTAMQMRNQIDYLEKEIAKVAPAKLSDLQMKTIAQRTTMKTLWADIASSPTAGIVETVKGAGWMAAAKYYLGKLEGLYEGLKIAVAAPTPPTTTPTKKALGIAIPLMIATGLGVTYLVMRKRK